MGGYVLRHDEWIVPRLIEGTTERRKSPGRPRISHIFRLEKDVGIDTYAKGLADDREK